MRFSTLTLVAVAIVSALLADDAQAGPFRRVTRTTASACVGGQCNTASVRTVERGPRGGISAQAHAEAMASRGRRWHTAPDSVFEGIGEGPTESVALAKCCSNGGEIIDQGTAQSSSGQWFACIRRR